MENESDSNAGVMAAQPVPRKPYAGPVLEPLGDLRNITLGTSLGVGESGGRKTKTGRGS
jgi:hypothetical protein